MADSWYFPLSQRSVFTRDEKCGRHAKKKSILKVANLETGILAVQSNTPPELHATMKLPVQFWTKGRSISLGLQKKCTVTK
jgi:hypothetical protein